jgi:hypothetical protein
MTAFSVVCIAIQAVRRAEGGGPEIVVDVRAPATAKVDLFVERPTSDWALSVPNPVSILPNGLRRFLFKVEGRPSEQSTCPALTLKLTAIAGDEAIETIGNPD